MDKQITMKEIMKKIRKECNKRWTMGWLNEWMNEWIIALTSDLFSSKAATFSSLCL